MPKLLDIWIGLLTAFPFINIQVYGVKTIRILLIVVGLMLAGQIGNRLINGLMRPGRIPGAWDERRIKTLRGVIKSLLRYALYFVGAIMILSELNVDTRSILAGAGIIGLAVGIGAQNLVRDVVTGFFILFEDQFAVGDYVSIAGVTGTVEEHGAAGDQDPGGRQGICTSSPTGRSSRWHALHTEGMTDDTSGALQPGRRGAHEEAASLRQLRMGDPEGGDGLPHPLPEVRADGDVAAPEVRKERQGAGEVCLR